MVEWLCRLVDVCDESEISAKPFLKKMKAENKFWLLITQIYVRGIIELSKFFPTWLTSPDIHKLL